MHKDDQMTPLERQQSLDEGRSVDRMPIGMMTDLLAGEIFGLTRRACAADPKSRANLQIKLYETFGLDEVSSFYGLSSVAESFGAVMSDPEDNTPAILEHPLKNIDDFSLIDLDRLTLKNNPIAQSHMEALQIMREEVGHEVPCSMGFPGVFTAVSSLLGPSQLLRAIYRQPEQVHKLLKVVNQGLIQLATAFLQEDFALGIADPVASGTMIHRKHYLDFVQPYTKELVEACKKVRPYAMAYHICGNTTKILGDMVDCGFDAISVDNAVDLALAKSLVGNRVLLSGNVPPVEVMCLGAPNQVEASVKDCYRKAWDSPCGFSINTGCDLSGGTDIRNISIYMQTARKCAKYPYNPENFI